MRRTIGKTFAILLFAFSAVVNAQPKQWVAIYWPCWELRDGTNSSPMSVSEVDFSAANEWILFGNAVNSDGSFTPYSTAASGAVLDPVGVAAVVKAAHAVGSKVLACLGGANTGTQFTNATSPGTLSTFIGNIVKLVKDNGYDGVDIDWEGTTNQTQFENFVKALRAALPSPYILAGVPGYSASSTYAPVASYFDQINIQDYNLMGNWQGWVSWYASSVYPYAAGGVTVTNGTGRGGVKAVPSCDGGGNPPSGGGANQFEQEGIPASKIGIGAEFGGDIWQGGVVADSAGQPVNSGNGITMADESWSTAPSWVGDQSYASIMSKFGQYPVRWDSAAEASYISIDNPGNANDYFITFDDSNSFRAKMAYVKKNGLGGMIIWDFGMAGKYAPGLLASIKSDLYGEDTPPVPPDSIQSTPNMVIYSDSIRVPWVSVSYGETLNDSSGKTFNGNRVLQVNLQPWGALSVQYGSWSDSLLCTSAYDSLQIVVSSDTTSTFWGKLEGQTGFAPVTFGTVQAARWTTMTIPMNKLNPGGDLVTRVDISNNSGTASQFYLASIVLLSATQGKVSAVVNRPPVPTGFALEQNYPNPFNPTTVIGFQIPKEQFVTLRVYDILGRQVATLVNAEETPGIHKVDFDGSRFASGVYFYRLSSGGKALMKKMLLLK